MLLVVVDVARRREGLERSVAGMARRELALASWSAIGRTPDLAEPFHHVVAVDPPPVATGLELLASAPGAGHVHLAWGQAERDFTLAYWRFNFNIRSELTLLWRDLSERGGLDGPALEAALRGPGAHPREGAFAGRLLRVLAELGLIDVDAEAREVLMISKERTALERSAAFRAYATRLHGVERHLLSPPKLSVARAG